jgi:nicotinamide-nucleotide amidase
LTEVPGASTFVRGSVVSYATDVKEKVLGVPEATLAGGVVGEDTALAMARGAELLLEADVVVAVTGSAGPDPQELEVGTMVIAVVTPEGARARTLRLPGDRERVRTYATTAALHLTRRAITGIWW